MNQKPENNRAAKTFAKKIEVQIDVPEWVARLRNNAAKANRTLAIKGKIK